MLVLGMREMQGFLEQWHWMLVICGGECTGCRHPGSGNGGMPDGLWSKPGLRWRWPRRWDGMPIPLAGGLPSSARAVRGRWPSSSRVVSPRDRRSAADRTEGSGAGVSQQRLASTWPIGPFGRLRRKVVRRFVQERFEVSLSRSSCLNYLHRLGFVLKRCPASTIFAGSPSRLGRVVWP